MRPFGSGPSRECYLFKCDGRTYEVGITVAVEEEGDVSSPLLLGLLIAAGAAC